MASLDDKSGSRPPETKDEAGENAAAHVRGSMNIEDNQRTFAGFIRLSAWVVGTSLAVLVFAGLVNS